MNKMALSFPSTLVFYFLYVTFNTNWLLITHRSSRSLNFSSSPKPMKMSYSFANYGSSSLFLLFSLLLIVATNFYQEFDLTWGDPRAKILNGGQLLTLSLDKASGSGFKSKREYLFGQIDMQLKLVSGNSTGTVTAYYKNYWNNIISYVSFAIKDDGMAKCGSFRHLVGDLFHQDSSAFAKLLQSCLKSKSLRDTCQVHARLTKTQFASEMFIQNRLIDAYAKCGSLKDARKVFNHMPHRNTFSWNSIITAVTKLGYLGEAVELFESTPEPDQCSWNSMVSGFAQHDQFKEALGFFVEMHREDFVLNEYSYSSALSACAGLLDETTGTLIHGSMSKSPYLSDVYMGSALVDMYSKCGNVFDAQKIFDGMIARNIVSWNSLITCYEQNGPASMALDLFMRMMEFGIEPDEVTLASVVSACATLSAIKEGSQIHARVFKSDKFRDDLVLGNALVDMYAKCGRIKEARCVFDRMPTKNVVSETSMVSGYAKAMSVKAARLMFAKMIEKSVISWNALISGYTQNGQNEEALKLFCLLKNESVWPTHYTFGNVLNACANLSNLQLGKQVHTHVLKHGLRFVSGPESDIFVGNSLVDMYTKCGVIEDGYRVFEKMAEHDQVSWNAMIMGYAQNGHGSEGLNLFMRMLRSGEKPDHVTMIGVLSACSHTGMVEEGRRYFYSMTQDYGLVPLKDHYTCMVDLLGRAGCLDEAKKLIEGMPLEPDTVLWGSLLSACRVHGNLEMGMHVTKKLLALDPRNSGPYVLLSNMYADLGLWRDVVRVRKLMRQSGVVKQPGRSWIEIDNHVHVFMVKDKSHPRRKEIYKLLKILTAQMKPDGDVEYTVPVAYQEPTELDINLGYGNEMQLLAPLG